MKIAVRILSAAVAAATALSASAIPSLAAATETTNGVKVTYTRNYAAGTGTYSWDFSDVTETGTVGTGSDGSTDQYYDVGGGLSVHNLQLNVTSGTSTYDVYGSYNKSSGSTWVPDEDDKVGNYATRYVKFEPTVSGDFSFTIYDAGASSGKWRAYYTADGSLPSKSKGYTSSTTTVQMSSSSPTATINMTAGTTYIIALYSYDKASAMSEIKYTVTDNTAPYAATVTTADSKDTAAWSFEEFDALSGIASFDTVSSSIIDSKLNLGSGDKGTSSGLYFAGTGFYDSTSSSIDTIGDNGRYMLLAPKADGTLKVTATTDTSNNNQRLYLLTLTAASINDVNTTELDTVNKDGDLPSSVTARVIVLEKDKGTVADGHDGTVSLTAGKVYALVPYTGASNVMTVTSLTYETGTTHAQTFSFTNKVSSFGSDANVYITKVENGTESTSKGIALFDDSDFPVVSSDDDSDAVLAITITSIPNDTTVTSVTVE